jgi:hypothetical protein
MEEDRSEYRNGGEGFIRWAEDFVWVPVYPEGSEYAEWMPISDLPTEVNPSTGRSYRDLWHSEQEIMLKALEMKDQRFRYRLLVFCWPRGEAKSFLACMIQAWRFFCWPKQTIMLCANSKDQTKFVHFDIIRDIVLNSPNLLEIVRKHNVREKEIRMRDEDENVVSFIRPISSFSGIVSNITGYSFSEIFQMKSPTFFSQIDGSVRNVPNALGIIDSTVSSKEHILYHLYETYKAGKDETLFFSYRFSKEGHFEDYWHPNNTQTQLNSYRSRFLMGDFERYFLNLWSAGATKVFSQAMVDGIEYLGADNTTGNHSRVMDICEERVKITEGLGEAMEKGIESRRLEVLTGELWAVSDIYQTGVLPAPVEALDVLGDMYDTDWAILAGLDRADPMKRSTKSTAARTILTVVAKGLPGSRSRLLDVMAAPMYIYFLLYLSNIGDHSLELLKSEITVVNDEYDGLDVLTAERWGVWDLEKWCEENTIAFEAVYPTYDRQKIAFSELYYLINTGRFKTPPVEVYGSKELNILREELLAFDHDPDAKFFGSPEKRRKTGIQDDSVYSLTWAIFGGRLIAADAFRVRRGKEFFGAMVQSGDVLGVY